MLYRDSIYGEIEITEPVLLELMQSAALQRLRSIAQHGVTALIGITPPFSRFDHSVGTMLLVKKLGGSLEEQVAALLHDVSHTAFSHVIDYVFEDHQGQGYHEQKKHEFVFESDIPEILERHVRDWKDYMEEAHFSLLEQASPALCADRLDYFLRDLEFMGLANAGEIARALDSLQVVDGRIAVSDLKMARWMAYTFIEADRASWSNFREVGLYQLTAEAIKAGVEHEVIGEPDLWGSDALLWEKLNATQVPEIVNYLRWVTPGTRFLWDEAQPLFRISSKIRSIDPLVVTGSAPEVLSELDRAFGKFRQGYHASKQGLWPMSVVDA